MLFLLQESLNKPDISNSLLLDKDSITRFRGDEGFEFRRDEEVEFGSCC